MNKEKVRNFVKQYICNFIKDDSVKSVETITRYISYDMDLVSGDIEIINKFLMDNFGIDTINISLDRLCIRRDNSVWNELESLEDLAILEELLGLGLVSGLIKDDFRMRFEVLGKIGNDVLFLMPEQMDIQEGEEEKAYMFHMKEYILPYFSFNIDETKIEKKDKATFTKEEMKELMRFWFYNINELDPTPKHLELFNKVIEDDVERVVNAAVLLRLMKKGPEEFYFSMMVDPSMLFIEKLNQQLSTFEYDKREYFEDVKKVFLREIDRIMRDYDFHHKKTL